MRGYIFEYYNYIRYTKETLADLNPVLMRTMSEQSILTFGEYDRLKINIVENFARYRDLSELAQVWLGQRHSVYLYEIEEKPNFIFRNEEGKIGSWYRCTEHQGQTQEDRDEHLFWALTELPFMSRKRNTDNGYKEILDFEIKDLKEIINIQVSEKGYNIKYEIFGTLGTFGIIVLWFGNQFTDILNLVNAVKGSRGKAFLTARTLFSKNPMYNSESGKNSLINAINGKAYVQMTLKNYLKKEDRYPLPEGMRNIQIRHTPGEYDLVFEMDARDAYTMFEQEELFNHDKDRYQREFLQTKVTFAKEMECDLAGSSSREGTGEETEAETSIVQYLEQFKELSRDVRKKIKKKMPKTSGLVDTLDSLICDYSSNAASAVNENWAEDFAYTFQKNFECIRELLDMEEDSDNTLRVLRIIMNNLKQQIFHITEANSLNLENPKCHLRYTGQEDGVLFCYMGIIKKILKTAYQLESCNMQSEIIPIVTVDVVPIIESELYFDKAVYGKGEERDQDFKILSLNLPHVAFYDIPTYFRYMYHEIFHFIVPKDREERDYIIGMVLTIVLVSRILVIYFKDLLESDTEAWQAVDLIMPLVYTSVTERYGEIHAQAAVLTSKAENRDVVLFIANVYTDQVIDKLLDIDKNQLLDQCMKDIGRRLDEGFLEISYRKIEELIHDEKKLHKVMTLFRDGTKNKDVSHIVNQKTENLRQIACSHLKGMQEVSVDIPMIELTEMPFVEYLIFYASCLKNKLVKPEKLTLGAELKECLRVSMILKYYNINELSERDRKDFTNQFIGKYLIVPSEQKNEDSVDKTLSDLKEEAQEWLKFFKRCLDYGKKDFSIFTGLFKEYIDEASIKKRWKADENVHAESDFYFKKTREAVKKYADELGELCALPEKELKENLYKKYREIKQPYEEALFAENIKLFQHFQIQESLQKLNSVREKKNSEKQARSKIFLKSYEREWRKEEAGIGSNVPDEYVVSDFKGLARELEKITYKLRGSVNAVFGNNDLKLWYRGQKDASYTLLPSIMRETTVNKKDFNYLAQYQRYQFGEFKFRADGAPEMNDGYNYGMSDYLALMQHYEVKTNLMDWSEDAFTALYFALKDIMDDEKDKADKDAVLWIFSPKLYNEARKYMIQNDAMKEPCTEAVFRSSLNTITGYDGMIPNISVDQNERLYDMFLLGNIEYESSNRYGYRNKIVLSGGEEIAYLPLAVYTSRLNPRVRTQSGIFVAFNLYAEPSIEKEYNYMGLDKVQEYYLNQCSRKNKQAFLYKIVIDKNAVQELTDCLKNVGINRSRIYPELYNIGLLIK